MFSILSFSRLATAAVTTDCFAGWFGNATSWYADCIVWVASEPQIVGAYEVEVHNYSWADVYQNGQLIDSDSANAYAYDLINHQEVQPGVWVMSADATARLYAYKYDSNNNGVTMDELCSRGKYSYYQLGTGWIYDSSLDKEDCSVVSSE
jgi:hypothetical protein